MKNHIKKISIITITLLLLGFSCSKQNQISLVKNLISDNMKITSPSFQNNGLIPAKYTCDGENINPPLIIADVPAEAKSLVLIVDDPDAPAGLWTHWTVWNIKPDTKEIAEGSLPQGTVEGITSFGTTGYGGPCPPGGTHRYYFHLYALNSWPHLDPSATIKELQAVLKTIGPGVLDEAELMGTYSR